MKNYPRGFSPLLWTVLIGLYLTGFVLIPGALELRFGWELSWRLGGGWRLATAAAHAAFAFAMLFVAGALLPLHMRTGLAQWRNHVTGLGMVLLFFALAVTALGIYYIATENAAAWISGMHMASAAILLAPAAIHVVRGRRFVAARTPHASRHKAARMRLLNFGAARSAPPESPNDRNSLRARR